MLFTNLLPLYILIWLGYVAGRYWEVNLHSIARLCLYLLVPAVLFGSAAQIDLNPAYIALPFITSASSFFITLSALFICKKFWNDGTAYSVASAAVNANAIYFGLPLVLVVFGEAGAAIYLFMNLGGAINNATLSYYISARGRYSVKDSFLRLMKLPTIYAVIAGLTINITGIELPNIVMKYWHYSAGALTILGMMMIGVSLAKIDRIRFYWSELFALFVIKYLAWPAMMTLFILLDIFVLHLFNTHIYALMIFLSVMPLFANYVAYAAENNLFPERAGSAVLLSSSFSALTIPAAYVILHSLGWI